MESSAVTSPDYKYWAFISYSHQDEAWAGWLHKRLERYRVPRRLVGRSGSRWPLPKRVFPVFRDREELPGSADLGEKINAALADSRYMIVLCSPNAAHSRWVNEEIIQFKQLDREDRVLPLIIEGEPWASERPESGLLECFPAALRHHVTADGQVSEERSEPIAADARPGKDGRANAFFKLLSGLLEVDYDELRQRDRRRRLWLRAELAAAATLIIGLIAGIWYDGYRDAVAAEQAKNSRFSDLLVGKAKDAAAARNNGSAMFYGAHAIRYRGLAGTRFSPFDTDFLSSLALEAVLEDSQVQASTPLAVAISADSRTLVVGAEDGSLSQQALSALAGGKTWPAHADGVTALKFAPAGELFASGGGDGRVVLWRLDASTPEKAQVRHQGAVSALAFSPDGRHLAIAGRAGAIVVESLASGEEVARLAGETRVNDIAFAPDGRTLVAVGDDRAITLWEFAGKRQPERLQHYDEPLRAVAIDASGRYLAAGSWDRTIKLWDLSSWRQVAVLKGHDKSVEGLAFAPEGDLLVSTSLDETARIWDLGSRQEIAALQGHRHYLSDLAYAPDGSLLVTASQDRTLKRWRILPREYRSVIRAHSATVRGLAFHPDGRRLASASDDGMVRLWDVASGDELRRFATAPATSAHSDAVRGIALDPGGRFLVSGGRDRRLKLWRLADGVEIAAQENAHDHWIFAVAYSPDGTKIASASYDGFVKVWQAPSLAPLYSIDGHQRKPVGGVAFSPRGELLATVGDDYMARLWEAESGRPRHTLKGHKHVVRGLAFSPDGTTLATTSADYTIRFWNVASGRLLDTWLGHHSRMVWAAAYSPDGNFLASGSHSLDRHTLRLWRLPGDQPVARPLEWLSGHREFAVVTKFSPDGHWLASGGTDGTIRLWRPADFWPRRAAGDMRRNGALLRRFLDGDKLDPKAAAALADRVGRFANLELIGSDAVPAVEPGQTVVPR